MSHLTNAQLKEIKSTLLEEKKELEQHFEINEESDTGFKESLSAATDELSTNDNHPADLGTETFERERDMAVDQTIESQLEKVEHCLKLIDSGEYGICESCGCEIPFERLKALPYASYCIEHTPERPVDEDGRPVEEDIITLPPTASARRANQSNHFDDADTWALVESDGSSDSPVKE
jgi:DnaK suppressor protein